MAKTRKLDIPGKKSKVTVIEGAEIELGDQVIDLRTGFAGTCDGVAQHLYGCPRVHIGPNELDDKGQPKEGCWFDMQGVAVTEKSDLILAPNAYNERAAAAGQTVENDNPPGGIDDILRGSNARTGE